MADEPEMKYYKFSIIGRVYAGSVEHANHSLFWALRNSEWDNEILIGSIDIKEGEK